MPYSITDEKRQKAELMKQDTKTGQMLTGEAGDGYMGVHYIYFSFKNFMYVRNFPF